VKEVVKIAEVIAIGPKIAKISEGIASITVGVKGVASQSLKTTSEVKIAVENGANHIITDTEREESINWKGQLAEMLSKKTVMKACNATHSYVCDREHVDATTGLNMKKLNSISFKATITLMFDVRKVEDGESERATRIYVGAPMSTKKASEQTAAKGMFVSMFACIHIYI
jgi:hypothetical protein